jgi:hypothetical protein
MINKINATLKREDSREYYRPNFSVNVCSSIERGNYSAVVLRGRDTISA